MKELSSVKKEGNMKTWSLYHSVSMVYLFTNINNYTQQINFIKTLFGFKSSDY